MKIMIEIDEERYEDTKRIASVQMNYRTPTIEQIVANGTPLPKGHGRLIDADCAYKKFYNRSMAKVGKEVLDEVPTIIEADTESEDKE